MSKLHDYIIIYIYVGINHIIVLNEMMLRDRAKWVVMTKSHE